MALKKSGGGGGSGATVDSFSIWQTDDGSIAASSPTDTGTITSSDGSIENSADPLTDTIDLVVANPYPRPLLITTTPIGNLALDSASVNIYVVPGNTLNANNKGIRMIGYGTFAANNNTKQLTLFVGGGFPVLQSGTNSFNGGSYQIIVDLFRKGSNQQTIFATLLITNDDQANPPIVGYLDQNNNDSNDMTIQLVGDGIGANDIVGRLNEVYLITP